MADLPPRLRRLAEELAEEVGWAPASSGAPALVLQEIDGARRPHVFERRVVSSGVVVAPSTDPGGWAAGTQLEIARGPLVSGDPDGMRLFADGLSSWLVRRGDGQPDEWMVFDRPSGSERDLVVLADVLGATVVQRHPTGVVRVVDGRGVVRWDGVAWHHEPPVASWIDAVTACDASGDESVVRALLEFAVHDLGARGIGALLIYRPDGAPPGPAVEARLPSPPPLEVLRPTALAPLRHALGQIDGAAVFDGDGVLRELGVRLVPSPEAEAEVDGLRGMRHTAARRYSYDDPTATVIVVSEDGPVTVLRHGDRLGASAP